MLSKEKTEIKLSDHFTYGKLLRFCISPIIMMVFTSIYGVVDGYFVSNFVGKTPFAAVNLIMPFIMILGGMGFMFGTGGCALVSKTLGEGDRDRANRYFSMIVISTIAVGVLLSVLGIIFVEPVARLLGADDSMVSDCVLYGRILFGFIAFYMLQYLFQAFLSTAEKPKLGLIVTVISGVSNMILDAVFMGVFNWGVAGAAVATGISQVIGSVLPLIYFLGKNDSPLRLCKTGIEIRQVLLACGNGASELMSNISGSIVSMVYNLQLMRFEGEDGVAAYGVLMYVQFIFIAIFVGYTIGTSPVIGYNYGAANHKELKNMLKKSMLLNAVAGVVMLLLAICLAPVLTSIFVGYDPKLFELTCHAFKVFSLSFLFAGVNIFASSFFTALNNGAVSAIISFLRTLVFQLACVILLPIVFGVEGIWWAMAASEIFALVVSLIFLAINKRKYNY